jgi:hypothetical protein
MLINLSEQHHKVNAIVRHQSLLLSLLLLDECYSENKGKLLSLLY